jgi:hypothetical protein
VSRGLQGGGRFASAAHPAPPLTLAGDTRSLDASGWEGVRESKMSRALVLLLLALLPLAAGCSRRNPAWASGINPCCGQDLMLQGIDPPEDRCADIVLDQATAKELMGDIASSSGVTHWHVRFIPGGPACIWRMHPGLTEDDFIHVEPPDEVQEAAREAAEAGTLRVVEPEASN